MTTFFVLVAIYVLYKIVSSISGGEDSSTTNRTNGAARSGSSGNIPQASAPKRSPAKDTYRPTATRSASGIIFEPSGSPTTSSPNGVSQDDLKDLCDAFTGEKLNVAKGLYRCEKCKVHYHAESYEVLRVENNGACVACGSANLVSLAESSARTSTGRNYAPSVVTLENVRSHIGRVITFEGHVHSVQVSRRGTDYAVMFEPKSWTKGFKLVFFRDAAQKVGGARFIQALNGHTVRVRGLVVDHKAFGLEIIISERSMIVSIR